MGASLSPAGSVLLAELTAALYGHLCLCAELLHLPSVHLSRHQQRHHGMLGHAVPAAHLQPHPPHPSTNQAPAHAPALPVVHYRG